MLRGNRKTSRFINMSSIAVFVAVGALVFAGSALGWFQYYVDHKYVGAGGNDYSDNNSGLNYNEVSYIDNGGSIYGLTLCNTTPSCYSYNYVSGGFGGDVRTISYGHAKCHDPNELIFVNHCYTSN
jgi:hypothetical protein